MISDYQNILKKNNIFNNYQQKLEAKACNEIDFINFLEEKDVKNYLKCRKPNCCNTPKFLLIFSIIIILFTCAGLYFSISRNEGYKQYKQLLEKNLALVKVELPNEYESKKLVAYLTRDEFENKVDDSCSYIEYSLSLCKRRNYMKFCNDKRYSENKCNYMDRQYFLNKSFICNITNYNNKRCNEIQYIDYFYRNEDSKIEYSNSTIKIYVKEYLFAKIWCKIGNYDIPILFSFFIVMILFIIFIIFDLCINKANLIVGIKYYIILTLYIIFYFIFITYKILLFGLLIFSFIVSFTFSNELIDDSLLNPKNGENIGTIKINFRHYDYTFIYCLINLSLFIFVLILSSYETLLYKYLSFDFEKNNNSNIIRKASIKIGKNNFDFEIIQNKNIYLKDRRENEKLCFKEIMIENNIYYLKFNNIGIKDQLGWIEYNYPIINYGFDKLFLYLKLLIYTYIFSIVIMPIFHIKDDLFYNYFLHLFDLGYKPYLYDNLQKFGDSQILIYNLIKYIFIIKGILIICSLFKWAFFGGFSNIVLNWVSLCISIFITLINLVFLIFCFLTFVYNIISLFITYITQENKISFGDYSGFVKLLISIFLYIIQLLFISLLFSNSIKFSIFLNSVRIEIKKIENEEYTSENAFKVKALNKGNYFFEAVNLDNFSKQLFYMKKLDDYPILNLNKSILFLEQSQEEILDRKKKIKLKDFKKSYKYGLSGIILKTIIICLLALGFIIAALSNLIINNKYYKEFRTYLIDISKLIPYNNTYYNIDLSKDEKHGLPSYTKFWCDFGNVESPIITSYLIFIIVHICFQIIQYLIHIEIIKIDAKKGKFYYFIILINSLFYVIFMIFSPLFLYLLLYSITIVSLSPFDIDSSILSKVIIDFNNNQYEKLWRKRLIIPIIIILPKLFIMIFNFKISPYIKTLIINYLNSEKNKKYDKNTSIVINDNTYKVKIISNEILYLKEIKLGTIYKFKQISIENITNGFVYVKLGHNSITDQISLSEWHYPELNFTFSKLASLCKSIYVILFISIPLFKCLIKEKFYYKLYIDLHKFIELEDNNNKPKFNDIFVYYGDFENGVIKSRFFLYIISIFFLLLFMLKRMLFGGFNLHIKSIISFIISLIFVALNSTYIILDLLMLLFGAFSYISLFQIDLIDNVMVINIFIQLFLNIFIFLISIKVLVNSIKLSKNLNDLRKQLFKFNNVEEIEEKDNSLNKNEFEYITIEGKICHLKEVRNDKLQRYLYYSLDNDDKYNISSGNFVMTEVVDAGNEDIIKNDNLASKTENRLNK